jgi:hypothetical protein
MYHPHELLSTPPDNKKLWRYLDLSHFLWLLSRQALYFANVDEFGDRWEGALPAGSIEGLKRDLRSLAAQRGFKYLKEDVERKALGQFALALKTLQAQYGVNCWHQNEVESVAMWKLYTQGKDGVAIQTTVGRLKACLSHEPRDIFIARVNYLDHQILPDEDLISPTAVIPIVVKRRSFEHESGVRLILDRQREERPVAASKNSGQVFAEAEEFGFSKGETVAVSVPNLIERIVASPDYPEWARASLQERVTAAGLNVNVEKSDLLTLPDADKIPYIGRREDFTPNPDPK